MNNHDTGCPEQEDIVAILRGELDTREENLLKEHFKTCPSCRALADSFNLTIKELQANKAFPGRSADLAGRILSRLPPDAWDLEGPAIWRVNGFFLRAAACFAILCVSSAGILALMQSQVRDAAPSGFMTQNTKDKSSALKNTMQWLASVQELSGRWDASSLGGKKEYDMALNGLALLTFTRNPDARTVNHPIIARSMKYLTSRQKDSGLFGEEVEGMMYNHGIVTVALLETYMQRKDPALKSCLDKALAFIKKQQFAAGGWGYSNRPEDTPNTSVSVWQLQALLLSARLGWKDQENSLRKGLLWLNSMIDDKGQFGYDSPKNSPEGKITLTAMGALCMFMAPEAEAPYKKEILIKLRQALASPGEENNLGDFYRSYFRAAAFNAARTDENNRMLADLQHSLLSVQNNSGKHAGSWSPNDRWGSVGGRIYSTSVAALTLEMDSIH